MYAFLGSLLSKKAINRRNMEIDLEVVVSYLHGPPDYLAVDQGTAYVSNKMKAKADIAGVQLE